MISDFQKVFLLDDAIPWWGQKTGYNILSKHLPVGVDVTVSRTGFFPRLIGKIYSTLMGWPPRNQSSTFAELEWLLRWKFVPKAAGHILWAEDHLEFLSRWSQAPANMFVTIHQPSRLWDEHSCKLIKRVQSAIVLFRREIDFFEGMVGLGRVRFIHYGVDTVFFTPAERPVAPRILYSGVHLRNTQMLARIVSAIHESRPEVKFDLLVPQHRRQEPGLLELQSHPAVTWHGGLNDEQLLELYRSCRLLLLPMNDSGANTAVVEALSCGLPIVTTDVGGIRDYGGGEIYPLIANDDDRSMIELLNSYLEDDSRCMEVSRAARRFAESNLAWPLVAQRHMEVYTELSG